MGRRSAPAAAPHSDSLNHDALQADSHALTVLGQRSTEISERFGDGLPYEQGRVVSEARFFMAATAEAMFELGKRLIQIKENEEHGTFREIVEQRLKVPLRTAQRFMACTLRLSAPVEKAPALALLGKTKLFELLEESDEAISELAAGGTIAGKAIDDMQAMTSRELRAALVEERKARAAKDKLIAAKDEKLNALAEAEHIRQHGTVNEREVQQILDLQDAGTAAETALMRLVTTVDRITREEATAAAGLQARQTLDFVCQRLADLCAQAGLSADVLGETVEPGWLRQRQAEVDQAMQDHAAAKAERSSQRRR